jgi:hypothetical protein
LDSNFINNIIPRLRRIALNIEIKEALVDKIWEIFDDPLNVHDYQFLRDKRLIMTHNGDVKIGSWEILPGNRLLIERGNEVPINLLYDFSTHGIILMKKAGNNEIPFLLYDKNIIPDGNIIGYLEKKESTLIRTNIPILDPERLEQQERNFVISVFILFIFFVTVMAIFIFNK